MSQTNIEQMGILEQNLSSLVMQRQSLQKQILENEHATKELDGATDAYQIVGTIMIKKPANDLKKELVNKKESMNVKLSSVQKQEVVLRSQLQELQQSVMSELKGD